jgi:hypothetical protein
MAGEALLNDGFALVLFVLLLGVALGGESASAGRVAELFAREVLGGALFGLAIGYLAWRMLAGVDHYQVEILLTLAVVMGGYAAAIALRVSGPIAIVVAGMLIGNHGPRGAMSALTRERDRDLLGAHRRDPERGALRDDRARAPARGLQRARPLGRGARDSRGAGGSAFCRWGSPRSFRSCGPSFRRT